MLKSTILQSYVALSLSDSSSSDLSKLGSPFLHIEVGIKVVGRTSGKQAGFLNLAADIKECVSGYRGPNSGREGSKRSL